VNGRLTNCDFRLVRTSPERKLRDGLAVRQPCDVVERPELPLVARGSSHGFTLVELLLAMFILAIGMVGVASIFPVAGYLQRNAYADVLTLQVKRQAVAIVGAIDVPDSAMPSGSDVDEITGMATYFPLGVRCYPQALDLDGDGVVNEAGEDENFQNRQFYWVPLARNAGTAANPDYRYYVFIMEKPDGDYSISAGINSSDGAGVPRVASRDGSGSAGSDSFNMSANSGRVQAGDQVLLSNGQIMQVREVSGNTLRFSGNLTSGADKVWYGLPVDFSTSTNPNASTITPTRRIIAFGGESYE